MAMHGQKAIVFSRGREYYEIIVPDKTCALKFLLYFRECKNNLETVKA